MINTACYVKHFAIRTFTVARGAAINRSNYTLIKRRFGLIRIVT